MALWGAIDNAANTPKWTVGSGLGAANSTGYAPVGSDLYQNTTTSAWVTGIQLGVEGVNTVEVANTQLSNGRGYGKATHTGWNLRKEGTGYVSDITISTAGSGYNSSGFLVFTGGGGSGANARYTANVSTDPTQNTILSVALINPGANYTSAPTVTAAGSNISAATFAVTMGGRVGRVQFETLVALNNVA